MQLESSEYLPHDVTIIVNELAKIWRSMFENATERSNDGYINTVA